VPDLALCRDSPWSNSKQHELTALRGSQPTAKAVRTTIARSSYLSPLQNKKEVERVHSLRDSLRASHAAAAARGELSPLPAALQSPLLDRASPITPQKTALQTPHSDAMRRLVAAASMPDRSPGVCTVFQSPMQRAMRQAPLSGRSPAGVKRPLPQQYVASPAPKPRRTLAMTLGCMGNVTDHSKLKASPRPSLQAQLSNPSLCTFSLLQKDTLPVSSLCAAASDFRDTEAPRRGLPETAPEASISNGEHRVPSSQELRKAVQSSAMRTAQHAQRAIVPRLIKNMERGMTLRLRSRSPPARRRATRSTHPGLPPTHDRLPLAFSHTPSISGSGYRVVTPRVASPTLSVNTPAGLHPEALQVPGAPMKKARADLEPEDLLGRISSMSVDSVDASGLLLRADSTHSSPPRELATRRVLLFDELTPETP
jgi:hypothetical protein